MDRSPAEVVATLLDEEVYLCSERTMYRVLASEVPVQERRAQRTHPEYKKPELMATAPNQVWSWDITRLLGPKKWSYYYLYVIMDIYSRYVVGWMVADRENSALAGRLIQQSCLKHGVQPRVLTLHSDRGAPMTSQCTAQLLADLGVTRSLSRPQVSDDNPFSEAQFKTLKYHPSFPGRFGDQGQAKTFCRSFFRWYNAEHRHGGISMLTPEQVHFGNADQVIAGRKSVLREAWAAHPERFVRGVPKPKPLPEAVFINPPIPSLTTQDLVTIPAGDFLMGSETGADNEKPVHRVWVDAFAIARYPVTRRDYAAFLDATGHPPTKFWGDRRFQLPNQPVVGPSWFDAVAYCEWLSGQIRKHYRLPTEAEREKAARGRLEGCDFPWGNEPPEDLRGVNPPLEEVGTEGPNGYGLYNMSVGVHEWCSDRYSPKYYEASPNRNPEGPSGGDRRAARGGAWRHAVRYSRCSARSSIGPEKTFNDFGFRCALTL